MYIHTCIVSLNFEIKLLFKYLFRNKNSILVTRNEFFRLNMKKSVGHKIQ